MFQNFVSKNHLKVSCASVFHFVLKFQMNYSRTFSYSLLARMCTKDGKSQLQIKLDISKSHFYLFKISRKKYLLKQSPENGQDEVAFNINSLHNGCALKAKLTQYSKAYLFSAPLLLKMSLFQGGESGAFQFGIWKRGVRLGQARIDTVRVSQYESSRTAKILMYIVVLSPRIYLLRYCGRDLVAQFIM